MALTRRILLGLTGVACAAGLLACASRPRAHHISTSQLAQRLRERMPRRYSLAGFLEVDARVRGLRMRPDLDRIAADMDFEAHGPLLPQPRQGAFELLFALRYEPADHSIRAHDLQLRALRLPRVTGRGAQLLEGALNALAREIAQEVVLHRLQARELDRLRALGLRPDAITVTSDGLLIGFAPLAHAGRRGRRPERWEGEHA